MELFRCDNPRMTTYTHISSDTATDGSQGEARDSAHIDITPGMLYYGNTVVLLSTTNPDGSTNIAPMSSTWALGNTIVLGMGLGSRTAENLMQRGEAVLNLAGPELWEQVERLGDMTGGERSQQQHGHGSIPVHDKFTAVGLTPERAALVGCDRVAECRLQIEVRVKHCEPDVDNGFVIAQTTVLRVHADPAIVVEGTSHVDPRVWKPLIYNFRHYHTLTSQMGESSITQTPTLV
ncbi:flavin reductase (DIM6/NTAB) family NADH-FMN oxidoreductase RutF [Bifidobacterium psychraerophilum DSM 22366]|uniref:Flavin reductase domain-containing protein FMN-binding domain n=2 Tax=Bifidobacterium psychraerophilum TaxID=218140 RepID=A0A087CGP9_9BIFI|nr:Flavin reductase domain-containing protein FMN-binding domain [Bifidobacterium psychraerophilum]PKA95250.1 flavin reductase (DIM6/NTAB) family NADH-FMN oxidoreductase RutF [Bifidobacterium psychraerophilum DSM 22366]